MAEQPQHPPFLSGSLPPPPGEGAGGKQGEHRQPEIDIPPGGELQAYDETIYHTNLLWALEVDQLKENDGQRTGFREYLKRWEQLAHFGADITERELRMHMLIARHRVAALHADAARAETPADTASLTRAATAVMREARLTAAELRRWSQEKREQARDEEAANTGPISFRLTSDDDAEAA